mgnify:CR=1 FL=1|jgi:hypothetical protein|tara:strand:- start:1271 stop:1639 length:369 start_codon:yes stop_codon:yes gene_type:complete
MMQVEEASRLVSHLKTLSNFIATEENKNIKSKAVQAYGSLCRRFDGLPEGLRRRAIDEAKPVLNEPRRVKLKDGREFMIVPDKWQRQYDVPSIEIGVASALDKEGMEKVLMASSVFAGDAKV